MIEWGQDLWIRAMEIWSRPLGIETATVDDADALAEIHGEAFAAARWSGDDFAALLREAPVFGIVARGVGRFGRRTTVGFVLVRAVAGEAEILTIAVAATWRRNGVARRLLEEMFRRLYRDRIEEVFLEVDAGNGAAVALYRGLGFVQVGERKGYYAHGSVAGASALVMRAVLR